MTIQLDCYIVDIKSKFNNKKRTALNTVLSLNGRGDKI